MLTEEKRKFDGFYIPVIPEADYLSDRDIHGGNFQEYHRKESEYE